MPWIIPVDEVMARFLVHSMTTASVARLVQRREVAPGQTRQGLSDDHSFRSSERWAMQLRHSPTSYASVVSFYFFIYLNSWNSSCIEYIRVLG